MRPLLAEKVDLEKLRFPVLTSPKFDGFRALVHPVMGPVTRSLKPVANSYVRGKLEGWGLDYVDGELLTTTNGRLDDFNVVQSKLTSRSGMPDFVYKVFDTFNDVRVPFRLRLDALQLRTRDVVDERVQFVPHKLVEDLDALTLAEVEAVDAGYEGLMLRDPNGPYKYGRSTVQEGILLKMKRLDDDEGVVTAKVEGVRNDNEATTNALGYTERSSHQANRVAKGVLGALTVRWRDVEFDLGTGFDAQQRVDYWTQDLVGRTVSFAYQGVGPNRKPRFPRFRGFRDLSDLV